MKKLKQLLSPVNLMLLFVALLNIGAIGAPILAKAGFDNISTALYFIYSFFCHQIHYRCLHIFDYQFAWCTRDAFIWFGVLFAGIYTKIFKFKGLKWYQIIPFGIPIILDGGIQLVATMERVAQEGSAQPFYVSTNFSRMVTGSLFGMGIGLWVFPILEEMINLPKKRIAKDKFNKYFRKSYFAVISIFSSLLVLYIGLITLWKVTSVNYQPANILDIENRLPQNKEEWLQRRKHGKCPVDIEKGFLSFKCENK